MSKLTRDGTAEPVSRSKLSDAKADREIEISLVHLTMSRICNLFRLIQTLAIRDDHVYSWDSFDYHVLLVILHVNAIDTTL